MRGPVGSNPPYGSFNSAFVDGSVILCVQDSASNVALECPVVDFEELRELAADVRIFIDAAEDKAAALRDIVAAYDVVFGIFPAEDGVGVHIVKGRPILDRIANSRTNALYTHTAI